MAFKSFVLANAFYNGDSLEKRTYTDRVGGVSVTTTYTYNRQHYIWPGLSLAAVQSGFDSLVTNGTYENIQTQDQGGGMWALTAHTVTLVEA